MVKRKFSKEKYVFAFFIAAGVFLLGLLLGLVIDGKRVDLIMFRDQEQRLDMQSLHLQYQFSNQFADQRDCDGLIKTFDNNLKNLERTRVRIENYKSDTPLNDNEFDLLKREYTLAQINYWLLLSSAREICDLDSSTILYFFSDEDSCADCEKQAIVLTWMKHKFGTNLLNFVFDGDYDDSEPFIALLKEIYDINSYPTLIVNGEKYEGFTGRDKLLVEICPLHNNLEVCV